MILRAFTQASCHLARVVKARSKGCTRDKNRCSRVLPAKRSGPKMLLATRRGMSMLPAHLQPHAHAASCSPSNKQPCVPTASPTSNYPRLPGVGAGVAGTGKPGIGLEPAGTGAGDSLPLPEGRTAGGVTSFGKERSRLRIVSDRDGLED